MIKKILLSIFITVLISACSNEKNSAEKSSGKLKSTLIYYYYSDLGDPYTNYLDEIITYNELGQITEEKTYEENGEIDHRSIYSYTTGGKIQKSESYWDEKYSHTTVYLYNELDSCVGYKSYNDRGFDFVNHYFFDEQGLNTKDIATDKNGKIEFWDEYSYYPNKKRKEWHRFNPDSSILHSTFYFYNEKDQEIKTVSTGALDGTYTYEYDTAGRLKTERWYNTSDSFFLWSKEIEYDENNRITTIKYYEDDGYYPNRPGKVMKYVYTFYE